MATTTKKTATKATTARAPKQAFHKSEVKAGQKLLSQFQDGLHNLDEIFKAIGNNQYLMRTGINVSGAVNSTTLENGKTKIHFSLKATIPANQ